MSSNRTQPSLILLIAALLALSLLGAKTVLAFEQAPTLTETDQEITDDIVDPQWGHTPPIKGDATILHGLDKTTARVFSLEAQHGQTIKFGTLRIVVRGCKKNPPEEQPEAAAFIEISEQKAEDLPHKIFSGWMFASSPAISAIDHPVYDIWVTNCIQTSDSLQTESQGEINVKVEDLINPPHIRSNL
jgi:hypothetical protein